MTEQIFLTYTEHSGREGVERCDDLVQALARAEALWQGRCLAQVRVMQTQGTRQPTCVAQWPQHEA